MKKDLSILNNIFGPAFVINLKRSGDRRRYINHLFKDSFFQYSFFEAIDARHIDSKELTQNGLFDVNKSRKYYRGWPHGELLIAPIACSLSHMKLWEYIIDKDLPAGIILEDDVEINNSILNNLESFLKKLPENWDLFYLGHLANNKKFASIPQFIKYRIFYQTAFKLGLLGLSGKYMYNRLPRKLRDYEHIIFPGCQWGTHAYAITNKGARKALSFHKPVYLAADHALGEMIKSELLNVYSISPILFGQNGEFSTLIEDHH